MNPQLQQRYGAYPQQAGRRPAQMSHTQQAQQQATLALQQQQQAQARHIAEHQAAARRAKKPTSRDMPDNIEEWVIGNGVPEYKSLREIEKRLDHTMQRKRIDINDSINRNVKRQKTMRIWITNTSKNQSWQGSNGDDDGGFTFETSSEGTWRVKIEGRLLEDERDERQASDDEDETMADSEKKGSSKLPRKSFSHFFKGISLDFDKAKPLALDPSLQVDWKKQPNSDFDSVEFERRGDENMNVTINLVRDEQPERYRLSQALSQTLDMEEAEKAEVVMGIWDYVKVMGLQEDEEKRSIRCDERLRGVFDRPAVFFPEIPNLIMPHLHPMPPIKLSYTIRVDSDYNSNPVPTIYDVRVTVDDPLRAKMLALTHNPEYHNQLRSIVQLDDNLALLVQAIQHSKAKHTFLRAMAKDPVGFIKRWMGSQQRDLEVILGDATRGTGDPYGLGPEFATGGKGGAWDHDTVKEAVRYMLAKPEVGRA